MTLTAKEHSILTDLKGQEELCIEKYTQYEKRANDSELKNVFRQIKESEQVHLDTVNRIMNGEDVKIEKKPKSAEEEKYEGPSSPCTNSEKNADAYLCKDALMTEKKISSEYDIGIFEFSVPTLRDTLAHIQKEKQNHGEKLYSYLAKSNMYS